MKFTKEQVIKNLKEQLSQQGQTLTLSDRTLSETLDTLMPVLATDDTELADFGKIVLPIIKTTNGNLIKEKADSIKAWEIAHPTKEPEGNTPPETPPSLDATTLAKLISEGISKAVDPLREELTNIKTKDKKAQLIGQAKELFLAKKPDPKWKSAYEDSIELVSRDITDQDTPETISTAIEQRFNKVVSMSGAMSGYVPNEGGAGGADQTKAATTLAVKTLTEAGMLPKKE